MGGGVDAASEVADIVLLGDRVPQVGWGMVDVWWVGGMGCKMRAGSREISDQVPLAAPRRPAGCFWRKAMNRALFYDQASHAPEPATPHTCTCHITITTNTPHPPNQRPAAGAGRAAAEPRHAGQDPAEHVVGVWLQSGGPAAGGGGAAAGDGAGADALHLRWEAGRGWGRVRGGGRSVGWGGVGLRGGREACVCMRVGG